MRSLWAYDGIEVFVAEKPAPRRLMAMLAVVLTVGVAPVATAGYALVRFWPMSGAVWLGALVMFWLVLLTNARNEEA